MSENIKPTVRLAIICIISGLFLSLINYKTKDVIAYRSKIDAENKRKEVLVEATSFEEISDREGEIDNYKNIKEVYKGLRKNKLKGYVFNGIGKGYGGDIEVTIGIDVDNRITGVRIGKHSETPGLGAKATDFLFLNQYKDKNINEKLTLVKSNPFKSNEIQAITGATITSEAVTSIIQEASDLAKELIGEGDFLI